MNFFSFRHALFKIIDSIHYRYYIRSRNEIMFEPGDMSYTKNLMLIIKICSTIIVEKVFDLKKKK